MAAPNVRNDRGNRLNFKDILKHRIELARKEDNAPVKKTNK